VVDAAPQPKVASELSATTMQVRECWRSSTVESYRPLPAFNGWCGCHAHAAAARPQHQPGLFDARLSCDVVTGDLLTNGVEVHYEGSATLGGSGRARLHDRVGGIGEMLWEALEGAGWVGEVATLRMTVALRVGVAPAPAIAPRRSARFEPLPGRARRLGEKGQIDDHGVAWQERVGPLNIRAAGPGYRLLECERRSEDLEFGEDTLYTAAVRAGWLVGEPSEGVDVPDVRITVSVVRRNPRWEAFASGTADLGAAPPAAADPIVSAISESELLALALNVAARNGDPNPGLIQHARGSRFDVTRTTGSIVFGDAPSYIIVMKGNFRRRRPRLRHHAEEEFVCYPFQTLVIDIETGKITDSGSSHQAPDLTSLGEVVTDHPHG
jgi:hypothetical protein